MDKESKITIYPSELHTFAYCPRLYFFNIYTPVERPLTQRIRLLLGRVYHYLKGLLASRKGYRVEQTVSTELGSILLRGRPDAYREDDSSVEIVERKSGRGPREGVWLSDMLQVTAYGVMLKGSRDHVVLKVEYRTGTRQSVLDSDKVAYLYKALDDIVLVKKYGIVPYANRSPKRCSKCPYREICEELDKQLYDEDLYEPGAFVAEKGVDKSFRDLA